MIQRRQLVLHGANLAFAILLLTGSIALLSTFGCGGKKKPNDAKKSTTPSAQSAPPAPVSARKTGPTAKSAEAPPNNKSKEAVKSTKSAEKPPKEKQDKPEAGEGADKKVNHCSALPSSVHDIALGSGAGQGRRRKAATGRGGHEGEDEEVGHEGAHGHRSTEQQGEGQRREGRGRQGKAADAGRAQAEGLPAHRQGGKFIALSPSLLHQNRFRRRSWKAT